MLDNPSFTRFLTVCDLRYAALTFFIFEDKVL